MVRRGVPVDPESPPPPNGQMQQQTEGGYDEGGPVEQTNHHDEAEEEEADGETNENTSMIQGVADSAMNGGGGGGGVHEEPATSEPCVTNIGGRKVECKAVEFSPGGCYLKLDSFFFSTVFEFFTNGGNFVCWTILRWEVCWILRHISAHKMGAWVSMNATTVSCLQWIAI